FMGEEHGETAPFPYFTSHGDSALIEAVRKGRRDEFAAFQWKGECPDPQDEATFLRAGLCRDPASGRVLRDFYQELIRLGKALPALALLSKEHLEVVGFERQKTLFVRRWTEGDEAFQVLNFGTGPATLTVPVPQGRWHKVLDSAEVRWLGGGSGLPDRLLSEGEAEVAVRPLAFVLYSRSEAG